MLTKTITVAADFMIAHMQMDGRLRQKPFKSALRVAPNSVLCAVDSRIILLLKKLRFPPKFGNGYLPLSLRKARPYRQPEIKLNYLG